MADQVEFTDLGYVVFEWTDEDEDGKTKSHKVRWRRPPLRVYREMRNLLRELADSTQGLRDELRAHLYALEHSETGQKPTGFPEDQPYTLPDDFEFQAYFDRVGEIRDEIQDYTIPWIREADQRLATSTRLPEDDGDWPSWLGTASLPSDIIRFWQTVPLAPGAKGTNNPPKRQ